MLRCVPITDQNREQYLPQLASLSHQLEFPVGQERYHLDHGKDYFAFYRRLGQPTCYVALDGPRVVASAVAVLRELTAIGSPLRAWYLADLKVHPEYRDREVPEAILRRGFLPSYLLCRRAFSVVLYRTDGEPTLGARALQSFLWAHFSVGAKLSIFRMSTSELRSFKPELERHRGEISFLSLSGKRDYVSSRSEPQPWHIQFGPFAEGGTTEISQDASFVFCAPESDALAEAAKNAHLEQIAMASVLQHRLSEVDWKWFLTSDI